MCPGHATTRWVQDTSPHRFQHDPHSSTLCVSSVMILPSGVSFRGALNSGGYTRNAPNSGRDLANERKGSTWREDGAAQWRRFSERHPSCSAKNNAKSHSSHATYERDTSGKCSMHPISWTHADYGSVTRDRLSKTYKRATAASIRVESLSLHPRRCRKCSTIQLIHIDSTGYERDYPEY